MLSVNQIAGVPNQPFLQNKWMKQPNFLHFDTNSQKLKVDRKFFGWVWSKMTGQFGLWTLNLKFTISHE